MPVRGRSRSRGGFASQIRRKRVWARTLFEPAPATLGALDLLAQFRGANAFGSQPIGSTVARIRVSGVVARVTTPESVFVGIIKDSRNHTAPEVPNPFGEPDEDWMFHKLQGLSGESGRTGEFREIDWDIKSMRKIEEAGDTIWFVYDTGDILTVDWRLMFSVLLLLP